MSNDHLTREAVCEALRAFATRIEAGEGTGGVTMHMTPEGINVRILDYVSQRIEDMPVNGKAVT